MPRIRTIKPEFWDSPDMRGCDPWARLLFIALWQWADDQGRGTANVRELAAFAFPDELDPIVPTAKELPSLLKEIRGRFGVVFYEVRGRRYYWVPTFDKHQRTERKAKSRYPGPEEGTEYDPDPSGLRESDPPSAAKEVPPHSDGSSAALDGRSGTGTGEQGNRGTGEEPPSSSIASDRDVERVRDDVENVCRYLADRIEANGSKRPRITKRWRDSARLMLDVDGRTEAQIHTAIAWCQDDEFWRGNILSLPKLRDKYDQLRLAAQRGRAGNVVALRGDRGPARSTTDERVAAAVALANRFAAEEQQS